MGAHFTTEIDDGPGSTWSGAKLKAFLCLGQRTASGFEMGICRFVLSIEELCIQELLDNFPVDHQVFLNCMS